MKLLYVKIFFTVNLTLSFIRYTDIWEPDVVICVSAFLNSFLKLLKNFLNCFLKSFLAKLYHNLK